MIKSAIGIVLGIIILFASIYWIWISYSGYEKDATPVYLGIVVLIADIIWLGLDASSLYAEVQAVKSANKTGEEKKPPEATT